MSNDHMSSTNETKDESDTNDSTNEENILDTTQETKEATSEKEEDLNGTSLAEGKIIQNTSEEEEVGENIPLISKETRIQNDSEAEEGGKHIPKLSKEKSIQNASEAEEAGGKNILKSPKETDIKHASDSTPSAQILEENSPMNKENAEKSNTNLKIVETLDEEQYYSSSKNDNAENDTREKSFEEKQNYYESMSKGTSQTAKKQVSIKVDDISETSKPDTEYKVKMNKNGKEKNVNPLDLSRKWKICIVLVMFVLIAVIVILVVFLSIEGRNNQMSDNPTDNLTNCEKTKENEPFFQFPLPAEENNNVYVKYYMPCTGSYRLVSQLKTNITRICKKLETAYHYRLECKPVDGKQCTVECLKECMTFLITVPKIDILILEMDESCIRKGGYINLWKSQEQ